jgi:predicted O-methyltransferase YrrM
MQADLFPDPKLFAFLEKISVKESDAQTSLRHQVEHLELATMQISPLQGQLLKFLIKFQQPKLCLELGTYCGYSSLTIAEALPTSAHLHTCDVNIRTTQFAKNIWQEAGVANKITLHLQPALKTLLNFSRTHLSTFDFIFIDADKTQYPTYYLLAKDLLRSGGMMIIDNITWQGQIHNNEIQHRQINGIRRCNEIIQHDKDVISCIIPLGDGMFLIQKV